MISWISQHHFNHVLAWKAKFTTFRVIFQTDILSTLICQSFSWFLYKVSLDHVFCHVDFCMCANWSRRICYILLIYHNIVFMFCKYLEIEHLTLPSTLTTNYYHLALSALVFTNDSLLSTKTHTLSVLSDLHSSAVAWSIEVFWLPLKESRLFFSF